MLNWSTRTGLNRKGAHQEGSSMKTVGVYEAKTHLPKLLGRVARGERILITRHGRPLAMLTPVENKERPNVGQIVEDMLECRDREGPTLGPDLTIRDLIEEGRR